MKTYRITLLFIITFHFSFCQAQSLFNQKEVQATHTTYQVIGLDKPAYMSISVFNQKNSLTDKKMTVSSERLSKIELQDSKGLVKSFWDTFSEEQIKGLLPEKKIGVTFFVNPSGKILELTFLMDKNTNITPQELERLEAALKKNVVFKLDPNQTKGGNFFPFFINISFDKVLDRTLEWKG